MRFLADMGVSPRVVAWLRSQGHDALHVRDEGLHRSKDSEIFRKAIREDRILLTFDLDFGEIAAFTQSLRSRTIVFRLADTRTASVQARLEATLLELGETLETSVVITVEDSRQRVRRLPIGEGSGES